MQIATAELVQHRTSSWLGTSASQGRLKSIQRPEAGMKLMSHNCVPVFQDLSSFSKPSYKNEQSWTAMS